MTVQNVDPAVTALSRSLLPECEQLAHDMVERIHDEVPLYRDAEVLGRADLLASCQDNLGYVLSNLAGVPVRSGAARRTGVARAERGVPYAAVLQAYRVGGRFIWELLVARSDPEVRDILLAAAADIWAVTDELSAQVTEAYASTLADRARRDGQMRATLLASLLDEPGVVTGQFWETASVLNLPREGELVMVVAERDTSSSGSSTKSPAGHSGVDTGYEALPGVEELLRRSDVTSVWRLDGQYHEGVVAMRPGFDLQRLIDTLADLARGRVGLSLVFDSVDRAHAARLEARQACAAITPHQHEVGVYGQRPLAAFLAMNADATHEFARQVIGPVLELPGDDGLVLLETARVWLDADGSSSAAAGRMYLHRNTVRYRIKRLRELTGRDLARPIDAAELHVALECARVLGLANRGLRQA
jgi:sugar diacid utilization regulator